MWVCLPTGFYSAVEDPEDDRVVQVRSRSEKDALALARWLVENEQIELDETYPTAESLVLKWPGRDYPCRLLLWKEQWAEFMYAQAMGIDWSNFKDEVKKRQGAKRADTYGQVWGVLLQIEREDQPSGKAQAWGSSDDGFAYADWLQGRSLFSGAGSISDGEIRSVGLNDSDERCPRCDKFLSDTGVDAYGDCLKCIEDLEAAEERGDFADADDIKFELGIADDIIN